jgi:hypothetical protein
MYGGGRLGRRGRTSETSGRRSNGEANGVLGVYSLNSRLPDRAGAGLNLMEGLDCWISCRVFGLLRVSAVC